MPELRMLSQSVWLMTTTACSVALRGSAGPLTLAARQSRARFALEKGIGCPRTMGARADQKIAHVSSDV
jgi:hypothetical protein